MIMIVTCWYLERRGMMVVDNLKGLGTDAVSIGIYGLKEVKVVRDETNCTPKKKGNKMEKCIPSPFRFRS